MRTQFRPKTALQYMHGDVIVVATVRAAHLSIFY